MMDDVRWDINLRVVAHKRNNIWVAWCPALRVVTQADTLPSVKTAIKEAVEGWFESCIERDVLQEALVELGFTLSDLSTNGSADISPQIAYFTAKLPPITRQGCHPFHTKAATPKEVDSQKVLSTIDAITRQLQ